MTRRTRRRVLQYHSRAVHRRASLSASYRADLLEGRTSPQYCRRLSYLDRRGVVGPSVTRFPSVFRGSPFLFRNSVLSGPNSVAIRDTGLVTSRREARKFAINRHIGLRLAQQSKYKHEWNYPSARLGAWATAPA